MNRPAPPGPGQALRSGPRPLPLHLAMASLTWLSSLGALPLARHGSLPWRPELAERAGPLAEDLAAADAEALSEAALAEVQARFEQFLAGVRAYWAHPYRRALAPPPGIWRAGAARVYDYAAQRAGRDGQPVLFVPSLVNRAYVLDLAPGRSLLRFLADDGFRPLLLDWGTPGPEERGFGLDDYITRRLEPALAHLRASFGRPVAVVGYCMGGLLALALALRRAEDVAALALLATPWDFHAENGRYSPALSALEVPLGAVLEATGTMPVDLLQTFFALLHPTQVANKFRAFAALDPDSGPALEFVQIEDWLNDGVPLAGPVARECLFGWYAGNAPARGRWRVDGEAMLPERLCAPALVVVPARDRLVPPGSAAALARAIPGARVLRPQAGHVGMVVGRTAEARLWRPLAAWLRETGPRGLD